LIRPCRSELVRGGLRSLGTCLPPESVSASVVELEYDRCPLELRPVSAFLNPACSAPSYPAIRATMDRVGVPFPIILSSASATRMLLPPPPPPPPPPDLLPVARFLAPEAALVAVALRLPAPVVVPML
jgi:hypothetical protein